MGSQLYRKLTEYGSISLDDIRGILRPSEAVVFIATDSLEEVIALAVTEKAVYLNYKEISFGDKLRNLVKSVTMTKKKVRLIC